MGRQPNFGTPIAIGLVLAALVIGYFDYSSISTKGKKERMIQVKGKASRKLEATRAVWTGRTVNESASLKRAYRSVQKDREVLKAFIRERGFDSTRIDFDPLHLRRSSAGSRTRYTLGLSFELAGKEVQRIRACAEAASSLMLKGLKIRTERIRYHHNELPALKKELLKEALGDARQKASWIADSSGVSLGSLQRLKEKAFRVQGTDPSQGIAPSTLFMGSAKGTASLRVKASYNIGWD
ncbi:MAG: SIMPL domain-containing protein [Flavobacteriales bacterium]